MYYVTEKERAKEYCASEHKSEGSRERLPDVYMAFDEEKDYGYFSEMNEESRQRMRRLLITSIVGTNVMSSK